MGEQRREVDDDALLALVGGVVVGGRLLDDPLAGADAGGVSGADRTDQPRVLVGRALAHPDLPLLDGVGERASVDIGDLGPRVVVQGQLRSRLDDDAGEGERPVPGAAGVGGLSERLADDGRGSAVGAAQREADRRPGTEAGEREEGEEDGSERTGEQGAEPTRGLVADMSRQP